MIHGPSTKTISNKNIAEKKYVQTIADRRMAITRPTICVSVV